MKRATLILCASMFVIAGCAANGNGDTSSVNNTAPTTTNTTTSVGYGACDSGTGQCTHYIGTAHSAFNESLNQYICTAASGTWGISCPLTNCISKCTFNPGQVIESNMYYYTLKADGTSTGATITTTSSGCTQAGGIFYNTCN